MIPTPTITRKINIILDFIAGFSTKLSLIETGTPEQDRELLPLFRSIVCYWIIFECIRWQPNTIGGKTRERDVKNQLMSGSWESTDN